MADIGSKKAGEYKNILKMLQDAQQPWRAHWTELAKYYLPVRYTWLSTPEDIANKSINRNILDNAGGKAAKLLASGLANSITSAARPWFKLRIPSIHSVLSKKVQEYLDEVERRMLIVFAESNVYNALGVMYLDLSIFGTAALLISEDNKDVINCYNPALGEFYLNTDSTNRVNTVAREFSMQVRDVVKMWPDPALWSNFVQSAVTAGGTRLFSEITISHIIEKNEDLINGVPASFEYRELYWETNRAVTEQGSILQASGLHEMTGLFPRWDPQGAYGVSPGMEALPDVIQLQHETKAKGQSLDWAVRPHIVAPIELENKTNGFIPGGISFVQGNNAFTPKSINNGTMPLNEMTQDIRDVTTRIQEAFFNQLFNMISQLQTVRSAREIEGRQEEKLVMLGGVLNRFENEALDPLINRTFSIMNRKGLLPESPEEIADLPIEIQYESILSVAQRAVGTAPTERFLQLIAQLAPLYPQALNIPDIDVLLRDYGVSIGVKATGIRTEEETTRINQAQQQQAESAQALESGSSLAGAARDLAGADVGGGRNALESLLGG